MMHYVHTLDIDVACAYYSAVMTHLDKTINPNEVTCPRCLANLEEYE